MEAPAEAAKVVEAASEVADVVEAAPQDAELKAPGAKPRSKGRAGGMGVGE
jgi:hypothetical protein